MASPDICYLEVERHFAEAISAEWPLLMQVGVSVVETGALGGG